MKKSTKIEQDCFCFCFCVDVFDHYNALIIITKVAAKIYFFELPFNVRYPPFILTTWGKKLKNYRKFSATIQLLKMFLHYPR